MEEIVNKVAKSGLITLELEHFYTEGERMVIDLKDRLWQGLVLKEKDFREWIRTENWDQYRDAYVAVHCSADAIVPQWAFMLVSSALSGIAYKVVFGNAEALEYALFNEALKRISPEEYRDQRVVIKGCSHKPIPSGAYMEVVQLLQPVVKSIFFGEPCSTVPVYKRP